ncbi:MAG TPA: hypothetical protein VM364_14990 [Vicinamibacterales bacterium]|nr:hypothetical protein [Vicinamibacterales bacterium]
MYLVPIRRLVAAAACVVAVATGAAAQDRPAEFEGYVVPGWSFTPGISLSTMWDSNVALAGRRTDGRTAGDRVLLFVPFGQVDLTSPRTEFTAGYRGYLRRYTEIGELNGYDQRAYVALRHRATPRLTWFMQNEFAEMPTTDLVELNGLPFARVGSRSNRLGAGLEARLSKYTDLVVRYENTWSAFDGLEGFLSGGSIHGVSTSVRRRVTERAAIGGEARVRRSDLTGAIDPRVIWFQDAGATFDYRLTEFVTIAFAGGLSHLRDSRFEETRNAPYYRVELERQVERASAGIAFERSFTPSFGFSGSNNNRELRGFVRMPFSRNRFYVQGNGIWRRSNPFFADEIRLDTFVTNVTFGYSANRWLRTEAYHAFSRQDSVITGGEVDRHRVGAQVVISQPMRIR